jgi:structural maintenance of chromosome 1
MNQKLEEAITNLSNELQSMNPNAHAATRLEKVTERFKKADEEHKASYRNATEAKRRFENVRQMRLDLFNEAFEHISGEIQNTYQALTTSPAMPMGGTA